MTAPPARARAAMRLAAVAALALAVRQLAFAVIAHAAGGAAGADVDPGALGVPR
jgi:hypothetical protein